ncbi:hypothetical protein OC845_006045 [Tilletia horrida]|nr:hypothetical protein OC845_006045 [Tilletia horrida]
MHHLRPRQALAVASLVFSALTFVLANPVSPVESDPVALLARGSVYAGGKCTTNTDCYSKLCVSKVCKLQPTGGPCSENGNCVSKNCTIPAGKTNGTCSATALLYPKAACTSDFQCLSGSCSDLVDVHDQYGDETGTFLKDDPKHRGRNCQYLSLNQSGCRNNLDCSRGVCSNSECTALADGSKCLFTYQCANVCSPKGTCYSPAAGSVRTGQPCTQNSQCYGQSCRTYTLKYTRPNLQGNGTVSLTEKVCDKAYYGNPCYSDSDCYDGACLPTNSTSSTTLTCQIRASCTEGVCYGPPGYEVCPESSCDAVLYRGKCRFDKDCVTNYCNKGQCGKK